MQRAKRGLARSSPLAQHPDFFGGTRAHRHQTGIAKLAQSAYRCTLASYRPSAVSIDRGLIQSPLALILRTNA